MDDNLYINYDNVSFDFPELTEYKYNRVNEEILKLCEVKEVDKYTDLWGQGDAAYDRHVIYHTYQRLWAGFYSCSFGRRRA